MMTANEKSEFETIKKTINRLKASQEEHSRNLSNIESALDALGETVRELEAAAKEYLKEARDQPESCFKTNFEKRVEIQIERSKVMSRWRAEKEDEDPDEFLEKYPTIFEKEIQYVIDFFDFEEAARNANKLGFTYGAFEDPIKVEKLIEGAVEILDTLKTVKSGKMQRGRLLAYKLWDFETNEPWYELVYFVEHQQEDY